MIRFKFLLCFLLLLSVIPLWAQAPYGVGDNIDVPYVAPGTLNLDGNADEAAWASAAPVDIMGYWDGEWGGVPFPDIDATASLLWTEDTLFVLVQIEDYDFFFGPDTAAWIGEQILIGVDRPLLGDPPGDIYDGGWGGAPWNLPDLGPTVYKIYDKGITSNWGGWYDWELDSTFLMSPVDSGWAAGTVFVDQNNFLWGVEMKIWLPQIRTNSMVGFNIGGAAATSDTTAVPWEWGEGTYAYYAWHPQPGDTAKGYPSDYLAGDIMRRAQSFGTLTFVGGPEPYGVGDNIDVPYVAPGTLILDGNADEAAWAGAAPVDIMGYWDGEWGGVPFPDIDATASLLWTEDTLFVLVQIEDYDFFFGPDTAAWIGEQILVGVDGRMYGDPPGDIYDGGWGGAPWNLPDLGPSVYKIYDKGITSNWGGWYDWELDSTFLMSPVDSGWAAGTVFVDQDNFLWGVEMKAYLPQIALGTRIGFNIGGAAATSDTTAVPWEWGEGTYAYYAWHPQPSDTAIGYPSDYLAGDIMRRAKCFGTLSFEETITGVKEYDANANKALPKDYVLNQNYPNPFNPTTNITYILNKTGKVKLEVYNILGKKVTTLVDSKKPMGVHKVEWDAKNFATGVYFYQLRVNDNLISTKKALIIR